MRLLGFSTGAVALGDFREALSRLRHIRINAIELSALRVAELTPLIAALSDLDLRRFGYRAVHAPVDTTEEDETAVVGQLHSLAQQGFVVVMHPDAMHRIERWEVLGSALCLENMDKRKSTGRTADELEPFFATLPDASLCLDVAHARQVDSSMTEAYRILKCFMHRLKQVHVSELDVRSRHSAVSASAIEDYRFIFAMIPPSTPTIIEAQLPPDKLGDELTAIDRLLSNRDRSNYDSRLARRLQNFRQ